MFIEQNQNIGTLTLASVGRNYCVSVQGGGVDGTPPLAVSPLVELELRGKDERVGRDDKNTKVPDFRKHFRHVTCGVTKTSICFPKMQFRS